MNWTCRTSAARQRCYALLTSLAAASTLLAQTAPAVSPATLAKYDANKNGILDPSELAAMEAAEGKNDAVLMNPFQVKTGQDKGYAAGNTLSGSRVDTPLKITPSSISVMTREFLDDFAITDMNQAAQWTVGMEPPTGGANDPFGGGRFQASFRGGDSGANFPTRDGALQYFIADSYNSERFEFSRGPSTALFGDGGPGGIQGSSSKQARLNSKSTSLALRGDSYGGYRSTFDTNYGTDQLGIRVNALHQKTKGYQDGTGNKQNAVFVTGTYKFAQNTQVRAQYERSAEWNIQVRKFYSDQTSIWNRTTVSNDVNTAITGPAAFGLSQISATNDYLVYNFGTNSLLNYKGNQYQTVGLGYAIPWEGRADVPNFPGIAQEFFVGPADSIADRDLNAKSIFLEHRFTPDWFLQLAYIASDVDPVQRNIAGGSLGGDRRIDVNRQLPGGAANPNFGKYYSDTGGQDVQYQQDSVKEYRLTTTYKFDIPKAFDLKQRFNFNGGWRRGIFEQKNTSWRWANNPAQADLTNGVNVVRYRIYWDQERPSINPVLPPVASGYTFREILVNPGNNARRSRTLQYGQLFSQTTFWDDRIAISGSFRRDKIKLDSIAAVAFDANYQPILGFAGVAGARGLRTQFINTKSAGIVVYPFSPQSRWLAPIGFIANYSSNFQQIPNNTVPLISGEQAPLTQAVTKDFGLRYSLGDGKAYLTLTHYKTKRTNVLSDWNNNPGGIRDNLRSIYLNLGYPQDNAAIGPQGFNFQDYRDENLEGWEAELTANPTRNLTLIANYSHPIVTTVRDAVDRRVFIDAHMAEFQAGAAAQQGQTVNGRIILDPVAIQTAIQNIQNTFNGTTNGTLQNNLERHRINLAARYRFTDGILKGFGTNAGIVYRAHKKIGSRDARLKFQTTTPTVAQTAEAAFDYLWTDPIYTVTAGINYTRRFGKVQARFQLNVDNLLDNQDVQWNGYSVINAGQLNGASNGTALTVANGNPRMQVRSVTGNGANVTQIDPRKFTLTTTFDF
jgi:outer membrane receptor protein involved in Fe transport